MPSTRSVTISLISASECLICGGSPRRPSQKGADACDRLADDQVLHLVRTFVGIERFGVGEEARNVVVGDDAVAAQELATPGDRLARLRCAERLRERRLVIAEPAFIVKLRQ